MEVHLFSIRTPKTEEKKAEQLFNKGANAA